ncbi:UDP-N-acetylenolpyruvoylglucosamine reductase [Photobacterium gaetbulicola]|uniref:UDP-N-acetylenolpyruvoylglucosamine reductase n=1 Tax=Photobacterium gaetbulicola TaxID=1295392 RepID=A0A0B9G282_9GAMM|nr:UDP-N-acetylmuramate dehydrogenase [Photobacterium gaetbulicola]KHT62878.1 UDP-N-acetylenolpyruvoylglucosamine reductase [Photobacterium gaetbulicola]
MKVLQDRSLAPFHTFGLDVKAKDIVVAETTQDLVSIWQDARYQELPKLILGQGSNVLFCDDFAGVVVLNRISGIEIEETQDTFLLHVGAGEDWHQLVTQTVEQGMPGLENLALIPGCVGSSPIQNIGAYGVELKDICAYVDTVELTTGKETRLTAKECQFGYRDSIFKHELKNSHAITAVGFCLKKAWTPVISYGPLAQFDPLTVTAKDILSAVCEIRQAKLPDPKVLGNAGSFFKNPVVTEEAVKHLLAHYPSMPHYPQSSGQEKLAAGWLIDQCQLKGHQIGGARVHDQQALVLVNYHNAQIGDVLHLAQFVVDSVKEKFGIVLEHEVRFMAGAKETTLAEVCG